MRRLTDGRWRATPILSGGAALKSEASSSGAQATIRGWGGPTAGCWTPPWGDSLSIDDYAGGPGRGVASLLWRKRDHDFPARTGRDLTARDPTARLALLASDGATSTTVAGEQLGRLRRLQRVPTLATVTMAATTCWPPTAIQPLAGRRSGQWSTTVGWSWPACGP